jgi:hypothetical protein
MLKSSTILFLFLGLSFSNNVFAKTLETNIDGVVIKEFRCSFGNYFGNIVNRTRVPLKNVSVVIKSFDIDGDPIGSCRKNAVSLDAESGDSIYLGNCNCTYAKSTVITIR